MGVSKITSGRRWPCMMQGASDYTKRVIFDVCASCNCSPPEGHRNL